ncbi:MAG TPA: rod shape-determining protein [Chloroflexota bacterium]|nr:rod shape-determining protein [Chloroflexota bacterium]
MFRRDLGLDLGSANLRLYVRGRGVVLHEPSVVAHGADDDRLYAVGHDARAMAERVPPRIVVTRPIRGGVVADYRIATVLLRVLLRHASRRLPLGRPAVMLAVPAGVTSVESRALVDAAFQAGAREVYLLPAPLAAAIGANVPLASASGHLLLDLGAGTTQAAVLSLNDIVISRTLRQGGERLDALIAAHVKREHRLLIGRSTAEEIKVRLASAVRLPEDVTLEVKGLDATTALPRTIQLSSWEITDALREGLQAIVDTVRTVLEQTPPELASDIADKGILLTGGGALLRNLDQLLTREIGLPVVLAEDPLTCVAVGAGRALEHLDVFQDSLLPVGSA